MGDTLSTSRIDGTVGRQVDCEGGGLPLDSTIAIMFGVGRCTVCHGLANVDDDTGLIDSHTVLSIDFGEE